MAKMTRFDTLPKFNSSPLKSYLPNRKVVFQPPFFRGYVLNFGGVLLRISWNCNHCNPSGLDEVDHQPNVSNARQRSYHCSRSKSAEGKQDSAVWHLQLSVDWSCKLSTSSNLAASQLLHFSMKSRLVFFVKNLPEKNDNHQNLTTNCGACFRCIFFLAIFELIEVKSHCQVGYNSLIDVFHGGIVGTLSTVRL